MWTSLKRFFRRLFPERIFGRKLEPAAERRLKLAQARAEEGIVRAHVDNALMFVDTLAEDLTFDRAIDAYIREMAIPEPLASTVATRTLVVSARTWCPTDAARWTTRSRRNGPSCVSTTHRTGASAPSSGRNRHPLVAPIEEREYEQQSHEKGRHHAPLAPRVDHAPLEVREPG